MKKILMVINFFPPAGGGGVYRPLSFVKHLVPSGWEVTVLTPKPGEFWIEDRSLLDKVPDKVRVERTFSLSGQRLINILRRNGKKGKSIRSSSGFGILRTIADFLLLPDTYIGWFPFAVGRGKKLIEQSHFDCIYSTSPPDSTHLIAKRLSSWSGIPWVADFRDPWINLYLKDPPTPIHRFLHERFEKLVMSATKIIVTTDWHRDELRRKYGAREVVKIPNGYDEDDFDGLESIVPDRERFEILHCGMLTLGRTSKPFLQGLARFLDSDPGARKRIRVSFIGARESRNEQWVRSFGLEGIVSFEDNIPHNECVVREKKASVLLLVKHDDPKYVGMVPGKLYEYIGARRPILAVVPECETSEIVRKLNRGEVANISDPVDVAQKIGKLYSLFLSGVLDQSYNLSKSEEHTRKVQAEKLIEVLNHVTNI